VFDDLVAVARGKNMVDLCWNLKTRNYNDKKHGWFMLKLEDQELQRHEASNTYIRQWWGDEAGGEVSQSDSEGLLRSKGLVIAGDSGAWCWWLLLDLLLYKLDSSLDLRRRLTKTMT
jgi:hypothetical protein